MKPKELAAFILVSLTLGSSFLWIKIACAELQPFHIVSGRLLFGCLGLGLVLLVTRPKLPRHPGAYLILAALGILNNAIPFWLTGYGELTIDSSMAAVLESTLPLFTALLAHFFVRGERLTRRRVAGLCVGFVGILVLLGPSLNFEAMKHGLGPQLALLAAAACYAASSVFAARFARNFPPTVKTFFSVASAALACSAGAFTFERPIHIPTLGLTWTALAALGLVCSCLGFILFYWLINTIGPTRTMLVSYTLTLVAVALGVLFLKEPVTWNLIAGGAVILLGVKVFGK